MAVTDAYADAATYRAAIDKSDTAEDAEILIDLTSVSRFMELRVGRFWTKDAAGVARDFYPESPRMLYVGDLSAAPTSVVVDDNSDGTPETTYAASDYQLIPLNAAKGPEPAPYRGLFLPDWSTRSWNCGHLVRVTGQWGWPAVPEAVKRACIHLTAILRLETPRSQRTVSEIGSIVEMSAQGAGIVNDLIKHYRIIPV